MSKAKTPRAEHLIRIYELAREIEHFIKKSFRVHPDGSPNRAFIGSYKMHKSLIHSPENMFWWKFVGLCNEQSIEKWHQVCNRLLRVICNLKGTDEVATLFKRQKISNALLIQKGH